MSKKLFSILRYTSIVALVASLFIISGCSDDKEPAPTLTISETLASDAYKQSATVTAEVALDSTNKYLNLYPELQALMTGTTPYTLFAPSNAAFVALTAIPGLSNIKAVNPDIIKGVLLYHFVAEQKFKADLVSGVSLNSLYTDAATSAVQVIVVNTDGTLKTGSSNPSIAITKENVKATNGVVHVTGTVLIPPTVGAVLVPILGTMAATVLLGKDFSYVASLVSKADAGFAEGATLETKKISTLLALPTSANPNGATFFAVPNAVITAAAGSAGVAAFLGTFDATKARGFLLNHYVLGKYVVTASTGSTAFSNGLSLTPISGKKITVIAGPVNPATNPNGFYVTNKDVAITAAYAPIFVKDLSSSAGISNGVIQVIGGLLN